MVSGTSSILLAAGGTGGHVFPALSLARALHARGWRVLFATDGRGARYAENNTDVKTILLKSTSPSAGGIMGRIRFLLALVGARKIARRLIRAEHVAVAVGFGGYSSAPVLMAAKAEGVPFVLHEQNAVLGRANRMFARRADAVALTFEETRRVPQRAKTHITGDPVRDEIMELRGKPYPKLDDDGMIRLLVIGGSQGARVLSDTVPDAISLLPRALQKRLQISQQAREEDVMRVRNKYQALGIAHEVETFFQDVPERLRWSHLVIARAGATTLSELTVAGRPAIYVPLPGALDDHQTANAGTVANAGGGWLMPEPEFTPQALAKRFIKILSEPSLLVETAKAARSLGRPDATEALVHLVEDAAGDRPGADVRQGRKTDAGESGISPRLERRVAA